ncbi:MAG TPA: hybrid sensor histidine kinase/response regulator [Pelovirga sp.]|nr:hybrid sensor histidine kinase/response regulator [Pelovirga sp.]
MDTNSNRHSPKKLLIVDDEPLIRDLCASVFDTYNVLQAEDGFDALKFLNQDDVDIVLTDVNMPNIDGLEFLRIIRQERPDLPVILMTGYSDKELILNALKAGADDFITKPISILQLSTTVEKVLERHTLRSELADLRHIDRLKNEFLGLISHKLKTPTTAISLFIQNLAEGVESPTDGNFLQMLTMVQTETTYLEKLIQDLLYFSEATLQEDEMTLELTDLGQVTKQVIEELQPTAESKAQQIHSSLSIPLSERLLLLHPQKIHFSIRALLDNAIKFTPQQGTIEVSGGQQAERVRLTIKDSGLGIPTPEMPKIFNKFYQFDPHSTGQVRGFGLGLYYARDFIRAMGGQLQIDSQPGVGTAATIEFPLPEK